MSEDKPNDTGAGEGKNKPSADGQTIARAIDALRTDYEIGECQRKEHDRKVLRWSRIAGIGVAFYTILTVVIAGAGIWAAVYSGQQAAATREANSEGQRAFVTFDGLRIDQQNLGTPGLPYVWFTVLVQNSGNTPTKWMKYVIASSGTEPGDPEELYQHPTDIAFSRRITLPPHYNGPLALPQSAIPQSAFKTMVAQHRWYYVYGAAHYQDRFSGSKEHISKFCFAVGANISDASQPASTPCLFWNCIDDDCEADKADYEEALRRLNPQARPVDKQTRPNGE
jgi:hypothetical protein